MAILAIYICNPDNKRRIKKEKKKRKKCCDRKLWMWKSSICDVINDKNGQKETASQNYNYLVFLFREINKSNKNYRKISNFDEKKKTNQENLTHLKRMLYKNSINLYIKKKKDRHQ